MLAYSFLAQQRMTDPELMAGSFFPAVQRPSLPSVHRAILLWLLHYLARWCLRRIRLLHSNSDFLLMDWLTIHCQELQVNWDAMRATKAPQRIAPLL